MSEDICLNEGKMSISIPIQEIKALVHYCVSETLHEYELTRTKEERETFLSRDEVSRLLNVDLSTLWRWNKEGYLCTVNFGGKVRYRLSDINALAEGGGSHGK